MADIMREEGKGIPAVVTDKNIRDAFGRLTPMFNQRAS